MRSISVSCDSCAILLFLPSCYDLVQSRRGTVATFFVGLHCHSVVLQTSDNCVASQNKTFSIYFYQRNAGTLSGDNWDKQRLLFHSFSAIDTKANLSRDRQRNINMKIHNPDPQSVILNFDIYSLFSLWWTKLIISRQFAAEVTYTIPDIRNRNWRRFDSSL